MNRLLAVGLVAFYAIFLGSQITEGVLLVPYWQKLSKPDFYAYYTQMGPVINQFYTVLTVIAVLIPLGVSVYCWLKKSKAFKYSLASTLFSAFVILLFYSYFKGVNQAFFQETLDAARLKAELDLWAFWHWIRVGCELVSLVFLVMALNSVSSPETLKSTEVIS